MDDMTSFHQIWERVTVFRVKEPEPDEYELWCGYAREFQEIIKEWVL